MMKRHNSFFCEYGTYVLLYFASYIAALADIYILSGLLLIGEAIFLFIHWVRMAGSLIDLRAIFTLSWVGGQGIACLRLSWIQEDWPYVTWIVFFVIYIMFSIGYGWGHEGEKVERKDIASDRVHARRVFICIIVLAVISVICFGIESRILGFIPISEEMTYSYLAFYVAGVHYGTFSCILIPGLTILYLESIKKNEWKKSIVLVVANLIAFIVPYACMARFQLLFSVGYALVIYMSVKENVQLKNMFILAGSLVVLYIILTVLRHHNMEYINSVFEMKYRNMPVLVSQTYIYIANNFENFNYLICNLQEHSWGMRMLEPFWALTGLGRLFVDIPKYSSYLVKPELTTLTMFYDAYYDFGMIGVSVFSLVIGIVSRKILKTVQNCKNPIAYLLYAQFAVCLALSFFTTWFSSPLVWFWLILTGVIYIFVGFGKRVKTESER